MKRVVGGKIMKKIVGDLGRSLLQKQVKVRYGINAEFQGVTDTILPYCILHYFTNSFLNIS